MLGRMWLQHKNFASSYAHFLSLNRQYLLTGKHIASMLFVGECKSWFVWFEFPPHHCWVVLVGCFLFGFGWGYLEGNIQGFLTCVVSLGLFSVHETSSVMENISGYTELSLYQAGGPTEKQNTISCIKYLCKYTSSWGVFTLRMT